MVDICLHGYRSLVVLSDEMRLSKIDLHEEQADHGIISEISNSMRDSEFLSLGSLEETPCIIEDCPTSWTMN